MATIILLCPTAAMGAAPHVVGSTRGGATSAPSLALLPFLHSPPHGTAGEGPPRQHVRARPGGLWGVRMRELVLWRAAKFRAKAREAVAHMAAGKAAAAMARSRALNLERARRAEGRVAPSWTNLARDCVEQMGVAAGSLHEATGMMERGDADVNLPRIHLSNAATLALDCAQGFDLFAPGSASDAHVNGLQRAAMAMRASVKKALRRAADMARMIAADIAHRGAPRHGNSSHALPSTSPHSSPSSPSPSPPPSSLLLPAPPPPFSPPSALPPSPSTPLSPSQPSSPRITPSVTVAQDGSGDFLTVQAAISAYPSGFQGRYVVFIRPGVYWEKVLVNATCTNVTLLGLSAASTVISFNDSATAGTGTFSSPTVAVDASGFAAIGVRFENTAGKAGYQAVAFRQTGDNAAFYECEFIGWQDTLYVHGGRQYYRNCYINGSVDFVFGNGAVVLDNCTLRIRPHNNAPLAASGRSIPTQNTGIVILNSDIRGDLVNKGFLGRPWKPYARIAVINTSISDVLNSTGWLDWAGTIYTTTTLIEYGNNGPGSIGPRIAWALPGVVSDPAAVAMFYPDRFLTPFATIQSLIPFPWI
ncbi:hypothetical protein CLOM_g10411 [Closterium sp. NIES-68]|nr:hypothetical protein CLOM_g10411 [Closterium sp. NIES-68]GJP86570.1 hypothetical protein CLOP_g16578 [Closterium sp. NIES-67]